MSLTKHSLKAFGLILLALVCIAASVIWPHWRNDLRAEGYQTDIFVEPTGSCGGNTPCFTSIQEGINAAEIGATVNVAQGTYNENIIVDVPREFTLRGGWNAAFTLRSEDPSLTVIDGDGNGNGLTAGDCTADPGNYALSVEGFTFMNGTSGISVSSCGNDMPVTMDIKNNIIAGNNAANGGGIHGVSSENGTMTLNLVNNIIAWNSSVGSGGGIHISAETNGAATINLTNNTITENSADNGGGIYLFSMDGGVATSVIKNTILRGNSATTLGEDIYLAEDHSGAAPSTEASSSYSDIGDVHIADGTYNDLGNNINADPLFTDPASGDFRLTSGSPCMDQGTNEGGPLTDFEGDARPLDGDGDSIATTDIGADEYEKIPDVRGTVFIGGAPVVGKKVILRNRTATLTAFTDANGVYQFDPVVAGIYNITISRLTTAVSTTVSGNLKIENAPLVGTKVILKNMSTRSAVATTTDAEGNFSFNGVTSGTYQLLLQAVRVP